MKIRSSPALCLILALIGCGDPVDRAPVRPTLTVFAAASLHELAAELADEFERRRPVAVDLNFAGSNTLAQQIRAGARADVFLSADVAWVDFLERAGRTVPGSQRDVFSNRLVLIARRDFAGTLDDPRRLADGGFRFLALADPAAVPAGRYARSHLERLTVDGGDLWSAVAEKVVPALDVRAALALVASDPEIVGIVYATDAAGSAAVRVLYEFPSLDELPIVYRAVLVAGGPSPEPARAFLDFLSEPEARAIAAHHGFSPPGP